MKKLKLFIIAVLLSASVFTIRAQEEEADIFRCEGRTTLLNDGWTLQLWDQAPEDVIPANGTPVTLPHDWMISQQFTEEAEAESAFLPGGIAWYARELILDESFEGKKISLDFDGVSHQASVYVNGELAAYHPYAYTPFSIDIGDLLVRDGKTANIIAVRTDTAEASSRWYAGGGIFRNVSLTVKGPVSFAHDGTVITYDLTEEGAATAVRAAVRNDGEETAAVTAECGIYDPHGRLCASFAAEERTLDAGEEAVLECLPEVSPVLLWDTEHPYLYEARVILKENGSEIDAVSVRYGYRTCEFDPDNGFFLNGEPLKLKGVCLHHDLGSLGAADDPLLWSKRLDMLKEMGANAVRVTHNPASAEFMRLCAEKGFLVIEETFDTWTYAKNWNLRDYSSIFNEPAGQTRLAGIRPEETWAEADLKAMVARDRNNPAVIMWSAGNEILGNIGADPPEYPEYAAMLAGWANECDGTRPVTIGDNFPEGVNEIQNLMDDALAEAGGVIGLNYAEAGEYDSLHAAYPERVFYASETASELSSREWYSHAGIDQDSLQISAWDSEAVEWGSTAAGAWLDTVSRDFIAGEFVWTGFDYLGEPEPWNGVQPGSVSGKGPIPRSSYFGIIDTASFPKDSYYFYQSQWRDDLTVLHVMPGWQNDTAKTGNKVKVCIYTNAPEVELFLNGESLGRKKAERHVTGNGHAWNTYDGEMYAAYEVCYREGTLKAAAYDENGNEIRAASGISSRVTASDPVSPDTGRKRLQIRDDGLLMIPFLMRDEDGNFCGTDRSRVSFAVKEGAVLLGADSGDPADPEPFIFDPSGTERKLFGGRVMLFVKAESDAEEVRMRISSGNAEEKEVTIPREVTERHPVNTETEKKEGYK